MYASYQPHNAHVSMVPNLMTRGQQSNSSGRTMYSFVISTVYDFLNEQFDPQSRSVRSAMVGTHEPGHFEVVRPKLFGGVVRADVSGSHTRSLIVAMHRVTSRLARTRAFRDDVISEICDPIERTWTKAVTIQA